MTKFTMWNSQRGKGSKTTHSLYTFIKSEVKKMTVKVENVTKINLKIIPKPHALLQTWEKTCAKFRKDQFKTV